MMDKSELLRLKKLVSDIKGYAELYEDLYRTNSSSKDTVELVRLKMEHCKEQLLKLSLELNSYFSDMQVSEASVMVGSISSLGKQMMHLVNEVFDYESQKEDILSKLEKAFIEYHSGRHSYSDYMKRLDEILEGKQKEDWLSSYEDSVSGLVAEILKLNNKMFYSAYNTSLHRELRIGQPGMIVQEDIRPIAREQPKISPRPMQIPRPIEYPRQEQMPAEARPVEIQRPVQMPRPAELPKTDIKQIEIKTPFAEAPKQIPPLQAPAPKIPDIKPQETKHAEEKLVPVPFPGQGEIVQSVIPAATPEEREEIFEAAEEKKVESLLSQLKSGDVRPTRSVMNWLIERLKKQKNKRIQEMALDPEMLKEEEEDYETHQF
jgi:hypothetical protein